MKKRVIISIVVSVLIFTLIIFFLLQYLWISFWNYNPAEGMASVEIMDVRNSEEGIEVDVNLRVYESEEICGFQVEFPNNWVELTNPANCNPPGSCSISDINLNSNHTFVFSKKDNPPENAPYNKTNIELSFNGLTECKFIISSDKVDIKEYIK